MAGENDDGASPWERDDWIPDSVVPDTGVFDRAPDSTPSVPPGRTHGGVPGEPPPEDFEHDVTGDGPRRGSMGRTLVAAAIVAALVIGSAGALLQGGDDPADPVPSSDPSTTSPSEGTDATAPVPTGSLPAADSEMEPAQSQVVTVTVAPNASGSVAVEMVELAALEISEVPVWTEVQITVPESLAAMAPTDLVTLSQDEVLAVTQFPSGRSRQIDVSVLGPDTQLVVGDEAVAVFSSTTIAMIRPGEPVVSTELNDGVIFVESWTGTSNFIITTPSTSPSAPEQELVLRPDGLLESLDERLSDEVRFWSRSFSPTGDVLVTRPGGVYALTPDGAARRIGAGDLLATGDAHWATEECDETLRCTSSVVAWNTGEATPALLDEIESFGFIDPVTRISPDGRSIVYRSSSDSSDRRKILDVATGSSIDAGTLNQLVHSDSWAADSSGIFVKNNVVEFVDRVTGTTTQIDDLGRVRELATGPFAFAD